MLKAALIGDRESYLAVACFSFSQEKMDQKEKKKSSRIQPNAELRDVLVN